jgi:hypothetical protein
MSGRETVQPCHEDALKEIPGTVDQWYSGCGTTDYRCPVDGRIWRLRWQSDPGTGHDDYWMAELPVGAPLGPKGVGD